MVKDVETLGIGCHNTILNAIVNHLNKVPRTMWSAMKIALLGGTSDILSSGCTGGRCNTGRQCRKDGVKVFDDFFFASNHLAIASVKTPDTATCPTIDIVDTFGF